MVLNLFGKLPILMNLEAKLPSNFPLKIFKNDNFSNIFSIMFATGILLLHKIQGYCQNFSQITLFQVSGYPKRVIYPRLRSTAIEWCCFCCLLRMILHSGQQSHFRNFCLRNVVCIDMFDYFCKKKSKGCFNGLLFFILKNSIFLQ